MKIPKIDFTKVAATVAGHAAGGVLFTQVNKLHVMQAYNAPSKQAIKGAIVAGLGYVGVPYIIGMLGLDKGKGVQAEFANAAGQGMGFIGTMILANAVIQPAPNHPALFPVISGVEGMDYENELSGLGMIYDDVSGYEQDPTLNGYEKNPMLAGEFDTIV